MRKTGTALAAVAVASALLLGTTGCGDMGHRILYGTLKPKSNREYQRESALEFRKGWANTEQIRFTEEGSKQGFTAWEADAVVTIDGKDYEVILGGGAITIRGTDLPPTMPTLPPSVPHVALTLIYSDGSREVIE